MARVPQQTSGPGPKMGVPGRLWKSGVVTPRVGRPPCTLSSQGPGRPREDLSWSVTHPSPSTDGQLHGSSTEALGALAWGFSSAGDAAFSVSRGWAQELGPASIP